MQYVELHARSAFSFLEGASVPEALAYACAEQQLPAMALLDRNGLYGSARFHLITKSNKIKAHVGAEVSVGEEPSSPNPYYPPSGRQSQWVPKPLSPDYKDQTPCAKKQANCRHAV
jgi:error-prone DNA polymerase